MVPWESPSVPGSTGQWRGQGLVHWSPQVPDEGEVWYRVQGCCHTGTSAIWRLHDTEHRQQVHIFIINSRPLHGVKLMSMIASSMSHFWCYIDLYWLLTTLNGCNLSFSPWPFSSSLAGFDFLISLIFSSNYYLLFPGPINLNFSWWPWPPLTLILQTLLLLTSLTLTFSAQALWGDTRPWEAGEDSGRIPGRLQSDYHGSHETGSIHGRNPPPMPHHSHHPSTIR